MDKDHIGNEVNRVVGLDIHTVIHDQMPVFTCAHSEHNEERVAEVLEVDSVIVEGAATLDVFEEEGGQDG